MQVLTNEVAKPSRNPFWPERYPDETQAEYRERQKLSKKLARRGYWVRQNPPKAQLASFKKGA